MYFPLYITFTPASPHVLGRYMVHLSKLRNWHWYNIVYKLFGFYHFFSSTNVLVLQDPIPGHQVVLNQVTLLHLFFMIPTLLMSFHWIFYTMFLNLHLSDFFMSKVVSLGEGHHSSEQFCCIILCGTWCQQDITNAANLAHSVRAVSTHFLCCQLTLFFFSSLVTKSSQFKGIKLHHLK